MPVMENPGFGTAFVGGFGETAIPSLQKALAQYLDEARQRKAFNDFMAQTTTTKTNPAPTAPGLPPPMGNLGLNGLPSGLTIDDLRNRQRFSASTPPVQGVPTQTQEQLPITDPRFLQAAMQLGSSPGGAEQLQRYMELRKAQLPQYPQAEIPSGGKRVTYQTDPNGGPPIPISEDLGQSKVGKTDRYFVPRMQNGKPVTAQFGNMTRTIEDEYDRTTNKPTGVWKYGEGGALPGAGSGPDARVDKSYQYHTSAISSLQKPLQDRAERLDRLVDTINQGTPQADALIAPELITSIAGGQGSGVRLTQTEIDQTQGGRTGWESIKSAIGKWNLDPTKPFQFTDAQRAQVRSLVGVVSKKLNGRLDAINNAQADLSTSTDPMQHRKIFSDLKKKLSLDVGGSATPAIAKPTHIYNPQTGKIEAVK